MTRLAGACVVSIGLMASACGVGDDPAQCNGGTCSDMLGRVCGASLMVTGMYMRSDPPPTNADGTAWQGCWPAGMWQFSASIVQSDCSSQPALLNTYAFRVESTLHADGNVQETFSYVTDPTAKAMVKVSEDAARCEG